MEFLFQDPGSLRLQVFDLGSGPGPQVPSRRTAPPVAGRTAPGLPDHPIRQALEAPTWARVLAAPFARFERRKAE